MPSINRTIQIHDARRLRLNTCEGQVHIVDEESTGKNRWYSMASISLTREQAQQLIDQLSDQMAKNF